MKIEQVEAAQLAEDFGTPLYVYSSAEILARVNRFKSAFQAAYANTHIHYAIKANSNPHILRLIKSCGVGADCTSPGELFLAKKGGFEAADIIYTGNYESTEDLKSALAAKVLINLDDESSLDRLLKIGVPERISFRINPRFGKGSHKHITTGGESSKFGIPYEKAINAYKKAKAAGVKEFGVHVMTGSNNLDENYFVEMTEKVIERIAPIFIELQEKPAFIDLGGGFGIPYSGNEKELNIERLAKNICETFRRTCTKYKLGKPALYLEPGRYFVASSGSLLTRVTGTKESYENFIGVDAGMNSYMRSALYSAKNKIIADKKTDDTSIQNLCGRICESTDFFARMIELPQVLENDLLIIKDVGAYGYGLSNSYNGRTLAAEVLIDEDFAMLIRRRENLEELNRLIVNYDENHQVALAT